MKIFLGHTLSTIDMIGIPVAMNLFGREKFKSKLGGVCSIFLFFFIIWATYTASQDVFSRLNPKTVNYNSYNSDPRSIELSRASFPLAFLIMGPDSMVNPQFRDTSIYTIRAIHTVLTRIKDENGTLADHYIDTPIILENCREDYFAGQDFGAKELDLGNSYCVAEEQPALGKIHIQGVYSSSEYQQIRIEVLPCSNDTSNETCASEEIINQYMVGSWFNAMYANMVVNPQNYSYPNNTYKDVYYTIMSPQSYKYTEIALSYVEVTTDMGWLSEDYRKQTYTRVDKITEYSHDGQESDKVMMRCVFLMSQFEMYYTRSYKKVQGALAEVGMANAGLVVLMIITGAFFKLKSNESMMNELFDVQVTEEKKKAHNNRCNPLGLGNKRTGKDEKYREKKESPENRKEGKRKPKLGGLANYKMIETDIKGLDKGAGVKSMFEEDQKNLRLESPLHQSLPISKIKRAKSENCKRIPTVNKNLYPKTFDEGEILVGNEDVRKNSGEKKLEDQIHKFEKVKKMKEYLRSNTGGRPKLILDEEALRPEQKSVPDDRSLYLSSPSENEVECTNSQEKGVISADKIEQKFPGLKSENLENNENILDETSENKADKPVVQRISLSAWEYVYWSFFKPKSLKEKMEVYQEGIRKTYQRLDIVNVMKKLRELDKLRILLLDPDQLVLFNNIAKPKIQPKHLLKKEKMSITCQLLQDPDFLQAQDSQKVVESCYQRVRYKEEKSEIDRRLIEIFEQQSL